VDKKTFRALLRNFFQKVEGKQIVHMTIFSASGPHFPRNDQEIEKPI